MFVNTPGRISLVRPFILPRDYSSFLIDVLERISSQASDKRKVQNIEYALRALQENLERGVNFQIGFFIKDVAGAVQLRAKDETLRGQPKML